MEKNFAVAFLISERDVNKFVSIFAEEVREKKVFNLVDYVLNSISL